MVVKNSPTAKRTPGTHMSDLREAIASKMKSRRKAMGLSETPQLPPNLQQKMKKGGAVTAKKLRAKTKGK